MSRVSSRHHQPCASTARAAFNLVALLGPPHSHLERSRSTDRAALDFPRAVGAAIGAPAPCPTDRPPAAPAAPLDGAPGHMERATHTLDRPRRVPTAPLATYRARPHKRGGRSPIARPAVGHAPSMAGWPSASAREYQRRLSAGDRRPRQCFSEGRSPGHRSAQTKAFTVPERAASGGSAARVALGC